MPTVGRRAASGKANATVPKLRAQKAFYFSSRVDAALTTGMTRASLRDQLAQ
jgi:hypothetical protein